jgi:predicted nuclease with TOPRIM domain
MSMEEVLALNEELVTQNSQLEASLAAAHQQIHALQGRDYEAMEKFQAAMSELVVVQEHFTTLVQESARTELAIQDLRRTNAEAREAERQRYEAMRQHLEYRCRVYVETIQRLALELGQQANRTADYEFICRSFAQAREYIATHEYTESAVLLMAMIRGRR